MIKKILIIIILTTLISCQNKEKTLIPVKNKKIGGDFILTDHHGNSFQLSKYRGKVILLFFGYTYCPTECPTTLEKIKSAYNILGQDANKVQTIFITVDPKRDRKDVISSYLEYYKVGAIGLTGSIEELKRVAKLFYVVQKKKISSGDKYTLEHSTFTYIIDRNGIVRYLFRFHGAAKELASAIKKILKDN